MVDGLFSLDRDKALHLLLVTDSLVGYSEAEPYGHWDEDLSSAIESRLTEVDQEVLLNHPAPNSLLHLVALQGMGRSHFAGIGEPAPPARSPQLLMPAADLECIAMLEAGDPLALWKYARASESIRETTRIIQMNELDEFGLYRSHRHSYY